MNPQHPTNPFEGNLKPRPGADKNVESPVELVKAIPVHAPAPTSATTAPVVDIPKKPITENDKDLDNILKDVSKEVKKPSTPAPADQARTGKKKIQEETKPQKQSKQPKHVVPITMAVIVAGILIAAAVYAFKEGGRS